MPIPKSQLDTWSHQGAVTTSSLTYQSVINALTAQNSPVSEMVRNGTVIIHLQGSYAHATNIYGDSDVDIIVKHVDTFHSNKRNLPTEQHDLHEIHYPNASYTWERLREDIEMALGAYYGYENVDFSPNKSIKLLAGSGRLQADIVPAISYRHYDYFFGPENQNHEAEHGIALKHRGTGQFIVNYPDHHQKNATVKHQNTQNRYKPTVRIFKHMRNRAVDEGLLAKEDASSYFIQSLVYNVPDVLFNADSSATVLSSLDWLLNANVDTFMNQNEQHILVGTGHDYWENTAALKTIGALARLWIDW